MSASTTTVPTTAMTLVSPAVGEGAHDVGRRVNISSAIIGSGSAMLSTTWLTTSALVALTP